MPRRGRITVLTISALTIAGCARSDSRGAQNAKRMWKPVDHSRTAKSQEAAPPKILPETHFAAGQLIERQGHTDQAIAQYRKAVALNHNYVEAYHRLGLLLGATGQHAEATQNLRRAVSLKTDNAVLRNDLGFELVYQELWSEAETEFRKAVELTPRFARAHINLGLVLGRQGRFDEALLTFRNVLPETDAYYNVGLLLRAQQRYEEAAQAFRHILSIDPNFSAAVTQLEQLGPHLPMPIEPVRPQEEVVAQNTEEEVDSALTAAEEVEVLDDSRVRESLASTVVEESVSASWVEEQTYSTFTPEFDIETEPRNWASDAVTGEARIVGEPLFMDPSVPTTMASYRSLLALVDEPCAEETPTSAMDTYQGAIDLSLLAPELVGFVVYDEDTNGRALDDSRSNASEVESIAPGTGVYAGASVGPVAPFDDEDVDQSVEDVHWASGLPVIDAHVPGEEWRLLIAALQADCGADNEAADDSFTAPWATESTASVEEPIQSEENANVDDDDWDAPCVPSVELADLYPPLPPADIMGERSPELQDSSLDPLVAWYGSADPATSDPLVSMMEPDRGAIRRPTMANTIQDDSDQSDENGIATGYSTDNPPDATGRGVVTPMFHASPSREPFAWLETIEETHDALSIIRNEIACWDEVLERQSSAAVQASITEEIASPADQMIPPAEPQPWNSSASHNPVFGHYEVQNRERE